MTCRILAEVPYDVVTGAVDPRRMPTLPVDGLGVHVVGPVRAPSL